MSHAAQNPPPERAPDLAGPPDGQATGAPARILVVDEDVIALEHLSALLEAEGHDVAQAGGLSAATDSLRSARYDLVITALPMSGQGRTLLRRVKASGEDVEVIVITGYGTVESAVEAMKLGAFDYLTRPVPDDDVRLAVQKAMQRQRTQAETRRLLQPPRGPGHVVSSDFRMARVFELIDAVAPTRTTVLVTGESGTGKSLIARSIHARSDRAGGPFIEVACGALPDTLLESELFGHVRGAFTSALADRPGKFALADGGTLFLDEVATASPQLQVKLLRVLQERQFEPVGSAQTRQVDVRVVLATNHDLAQDVREGRFREDLYYRIHVINIHLPPLRERLADIPLLADHFLRTYGPAAGKRLAGFTRQAMDCLVRYHWPGNVRELENAVERAVVLCRGQRIDLDDLPPAVLDADAAAGHGGQGHAPPRRASEAPPAGRPARAAARTPATPPAAPLRSLRDQTERQIIQAALEANHFNRQAAARQLGINRVTLFKKMRKLGIQAPG